jgi:hypothetical protein
MAACRSAEVPEIVDIRALTMSILSTVIATLHFLSFAQKWLPLGLDQSALKGAYAVLPGIGISRWKNNCEIDRKHPDENGLSPCREDQSRLPVPEFLRHSAGS